MGLIRYPKTSVRNYHYSLLNNPSERSSQVPGGGNMKLHVFIFLDYTE